MLLDNKTVVITGAGPGVGSAVAKAAAREGASVVLGARSSARLAALADEIEQIGGKARWQCLDVTDFGSCMAFGAFAAETGGVDAVVNAAFWTEPEAPMAETPEEDWIRCLDVNVVGTWRVMKSLYPHLNQPGAAIVAIGSQAGTKPSATLAAYAAAKSAVTSLTTSAALQWGPGVRVNGILPGSIQGDGLREWAAQRAHALGTTTEHELAVRAGRSPLGRIVTPAEIAEAAIFLCSERASGITGSFLDLDCGQHLGASTREPDRAVLVN
ncbi:SDR family oxidoreductase [Rhodococcus gordoniae]|uniref:SDR family oxidoreductase n=1 Tax=Rhodococcus gordoniae TaxID=223392 RepID=UPI0020CDF017|nr:SDR family oxidoreductase [Rhodococcus gordoniae]UTT51010.1 SDR family oxidoreductase [Rhodococcus gordoniae]